MSHISLTPAQAERLEMLIEEAAELQQAATKALRHGYMSRHPSDPTGETNRQSLERELLDIVAVATAMGRANDFRVRNHLSFYPAEAQERWHKKLRWTHHQVQARGDAPPFLDPAYRLLEHAAETDQEATEWIVGQLAHDSIVRVSGWIKGQPEVATKTPEGGLTFFGLPVKAERGNGLTRVVLKAGKNTVGAFDV